MRPLHRSLRRPLGDPELVAAAQLGSAASLGLLLERHRARLLATAIRLLGYHADAEDAVQETCLIAMRHIGAVRDPESVSAWLHKVLRRVCLQHLRRRRGEHLTGAVPDSIDDTARPEDRIERLELRDWIWGSLEQLPESLRVTAMLRFFGSYESYDEVAAILGVPIGTVRSRLSQVKVKLADALLASAGLIDDQSRSRSREREQLWTESVREVFRRGDTAPFLSNFVNDLIVGWSSGKTVRGQGCLARDIEENIEFNVQLDPARVLSTDGIAVVEGRFVNPPEAPDHCPPGIAFVVFGAAKRHSRIRIHIAPRPPRQKHD